MLTSTSFSTRPLSRTRSSWTRRRPSRKPRRCATPAIWDELFTAIPDENFGLNLDPSHLVWLIIDYERAGYDHVLSVEHEDRRFEGTPELVERGFAIARETLRP